ncbi:MAG: hypothetical protein JST55_04075 [Bacteroidetes bacterium]|nr:hypothetical protein [Bacteroidota bacterium]
MQIFDLSIEKKKWLMFIVVFFYLLGPVFRVLHAYVSDIIFLAAFLLIVLSGTKLVFNSKESKIFLIPVFIVILCTLGKYLSGFSLGMDEVANTLNFIKLFFLFVLVFSVFKDSNSYFNDLKVLNFIVVFFVVYVSIIGILQFTHNPAADFIIKNFYHVVHKTGTDNIYEFELLNRVTSIFDSFNGMGIVLCFTLFILVYLNNELKNYWSIIILLLGITLIFLSGNRASLIVLFLMSVTYLLYIKRGINLKIFSIVAGVFLGSGVIFFLVANYLSFDNYIRFYEFKLFILNGSIPPTLQVRLDKWQWIPAYMKTIKQGLFGYTTNDFINDKVYTSPDNQYLNWLVYFGYIGLSCFIFWAFYSLRMLLNAKRLAKRLNDSYLNNASSFFVIYWIGLLVIGLFQESFFFGRLRELFVFLFAMISAYSAGRNNISKV